MNTTVRWTALVAAVLTTVVAAAPARAEQNLTDAIETIRGLYQADRRTVVAETLALTDAESAAFWPLYRQYRAESEKLGDELVKLVLEYADVYPAVPAERAEVLVKQYTQLEVKLAKTRATYIRKAAKAVSAAKALRWAQIENRMDLALRLQLASTIPLVPASPAQP
jgi:hypothetical protein